MERASKESFLPEGYCYHAEGYLWYVMPPEKFRNLPETVVVEGSILNKKSEFHVTIVNARSIARDFPGDDLGATERIEGRLQSMLAEYIREMPIQFDGFEHDLRLATTSERTSIAARCRMKNIEGYFNRIKQEFGRDYPLQPSHVSLYTATGLAIGINSIEEMESFNKIELPEVQAVLDTISSE